MATEVLAVHVGELPQRTLLDGDHEELSRRIGCSAGYDGGTGRRVDSEGGEGGPSARDLPYVAALCWDLTQVGLTALVGQEQDPVVLGPP